MALTVAAAVLLTSVVVFDVARSSAAIGATDLLTLRELLLLAAFGLVYLLIGRRQIRQTAALLREIGRVLVLGTVLLFAVLALSLAGGYRFSEGSVPVVPNGLPSVLVVAATSIAAVLFSMVLLRATTSLVLYRRKRGTKRNLAIFGGILIATPFVNITVIATAVPYVPTAVFVLGVVFIILNAFRQNWIVYLSRREKVYSIAYGLFLFGVCTTTLVLLFNRTPVSKSLDFFSPPMAAFVSLNVLLGAVYFGMAVVSTLFHLPTAEVYERRQSELATLHSLSRLMTRVLDFDDLVGTVTKMAREVCGARSSWLELVRTDNEGNPTSFTTVGADNIDPSEIDLLTTDARFPLRDIVLESRKPLLVDAVSTDRRTRALKGKSVSVGSLLSVPLLSQNTVIGVLHATSDAEFAFDQEDVEVLTTFADQVTIAVENSTLIAQSMERERYQQEMMVAQRMQRRLLPQELPSTPELQLAANSEPSSEVGGDYYDVVQLDDRHIGIVVGDVSGKGVPAAFYMAEVKGIFQTLSKIYRSPRDLLIRANETLCETLERNYFVSFLYAIIDVIKGELTIARAGHCPMLYVSGAESASIRPGGLGLGLTRDSRFAESIEERTVRLKRGDVCLFYTDGIIECRNSGDEEFGEQRLAELVRKLAADSADRIKENIWDAIRAFAGNSTSADDLTLVVLKWQGSAASGHTEKQRSVEATRR